ncbi:MAG: LD-carboxypeptidase [Saprospiraceae bacterium]
MDDMNRRSFISLGLLGALTLPARRGRLLARPLPPLLREGDTVALIAPGSPVAPERLDMAIDNLRGLGLRVREGRSLRRVQGYLAGADAERAADLHAAFADPEVRGVWCARGGYGCTRLLDILDYALIRRNPKVFVGFSDVTALHAVLTERCGMATFHTQVAATPWVEPVRERLRATLFEGGPASYTLRADGAFQTANPLQETRGVLVGGNLALMAALCGGPYAPSYRNKIVFIEDVGERPYRIDRMLTQLLQGSDLPKAAAIALGRFSECEPRAGENSLSLAECLADRLGSLGVPVVGHFPFGHIAENFPIPCGQKACLQGSDLHLFAI